MIKLLLHESKRRVGCPCVFIPPGTYFIIFLQPFDQYQCLVPSLKDLHYVSLDLEAQGLSMTFKAYNLAQSTVERFLPQNFNLFITLAVTTFYPIKWGESQSDGTVLILIDYNNPFDIYIAYSYETSKTYGYLISPMKMRSL